MAERTHLTGPPSASATAAAPEGETVRSADDIRQDIAARRESITETVDQLSDRFHRTFDWRTYVSDYPFVALGVAAGAGFLVAGLFRRRPTPTERMVEALADSIEDVADRFRHQLDGAGMRKSGWSRTVRAAATGALTKAATDYIRNRLTEQDFMRPAADEAVGAEHYEQTARAGYAART